MDIKIILDRYISSDHVKSRSLSSDILENLSEDLAIHEAIELIYSLDHKSNVSLLKDYLGEEKTAVIFSNYFYDVYEKADIIKKAFNMKLLYIDKVEYPVYDPVNEVIRANLIDVVNFIRQRKRRKNILYFSVHPVWRLVILYLIRQAFPEVKILMYQYDWLNLFCPYEHKDIMQRFLKLPMNCVESEYRVLDMILAGDIVDGILYKDGGEDFHVLKDYPGLKLFFPAYLSKRLYQDSPISYKNTKRFVYFGKLFSSVDCIQELFNDAYLMDIFNTLSNQDIHVDIYYVRSTEATIRSYRDVFKNSHHVRLIEGLPLDQLLPKLSGNYEWGCLINNYSGDFSVIRRHVESALPARIFSYMALGVPVVLSEELRYSADFIRRNEIGVVISSSDIKNIKEILSKDVDYLVMQQHIEVLREELSLEKQQHKFTEFVSSVINNQPH